MKDTAATTKHERAGRTWAVRRLTVGARLHKKALAYRTRPRDLRRRDWEICQYLVALALLAGRRRLGLV